MKTKHVADFLKMAALSIAVFIVSSMYWITGAGEAKYSFFSNTINLFFVVVLGFYHAFTVCDYKKKQTGDDCYKWELLVYTILFSGFYNVVMFPFESGIGIIEYGIVIFCFTFGLVSKVLNKSTRIEGKPIFCFEGLSPNQLCVFGIWLTFFKYVVFYIFDSNIYDQLFLSNGIAKFIIVGVFVGGLVCLFQQFFRQLKSQTNLDIGEKKVDTKKITAAFKWIFSSLSEFFTGPIVILIIGVGILVLGGFATVMIKKVYDGLLAFIQPLLQKMLDTGENQVHTKFPFALTQAISFVIVAICSYRIEEDVKERINGKIILEIRENLAKESIETQQNLKQLERYFNYYSIDEKSRLLQEGQITRKVLVDILNDDEDN